MVVRGYIYLYFCFYFFVFLIVSEEKFVSRFTDMRHLQYVVVFNNLLQLHFQSKVQFD